MKPKSFLPILTAFIFLVYSDINQVSAQSTLQANADTLDIYPFIPVDIDLTANDIIPSGEIIQNVIVSAAGSIVPSIGPDFICTFLLNRWGEGLSAQTKYYVVMESGDTSSAPIVFNIHDHSSDILDINNVSALFWATGNHFWNDDSYYEVPKGSGKVTMFSNALWVGGKDQTQQLYFLIATLMGFMIHLMGIILKSGVIRRFFSFSMISEVFICK